MEAKIFLRCQLIVQDELLKYQANAGTDLGRLGKAIIAIDEGRAGSGLQQGTKHLDSSRLTCTIRPQEAKYLTPFYLEGDAIYCPKFFITLNQILYLYYTAHKPYLTLSTLSSSLKINHLTTLVK